MVSYGKEKASPKNYKIAKTTLPGPGTHEGMDNAYKLTKPMSLTTKFKSDKRKGFAENAAKAKANVPSPAAYDMAKVKETFIHKRVLTKRH